MPIVHVTARADYAVRAALALVGASSGDPVKMESISRGHGIPPRFLSGILADLRRAGLAHSQRGSDGGYWLQRPPATISVADVVRAVDGVVTDHELASAPVGTPAGVVRATWTRAADQLAGVLESTSLADLLDDASTGPATSRGRSRARRPPREGTASRCPRS